MLTFRLALLTTCLCSLAACGPAKPPPAPEVLASTAACALGTGVHFVDSMAGLTRALYGDRIEPRETGGEVPGGLRAIIVVADDKPSAGHTLQLVDSNYVADTLNLNVSEQGPPADAVSAQVMTRPCLAVGLPGAGYTRVVVRNGPTTMATLNMPSP